LPEVKAKCLDVINGVINIAVPLKGDILGWMGNDLFLKKNCAE
jgi:hypothetical protein